MKVVDIIIFIVLLVALGGGLYFLWQNLPGNTQDFQNLVITNNTFPASKGIQFYPNMRYPDTKISFSIGSACDDKKTQDALSAFTRLENGTVLQFYQIPNAGQIQILCSNVAPDSTDSSHFIAGEGGPKQIIISGPFYVIESGEVSLYKTDDCTEPNIATHEILHALGFDHNNTDPNSIMFPVTSCGEKLDQYIIDKINELYSTPSEPDLALINATASKSGPYLSFEINVANQGLQDALDAQLTLSNQNSLIKIYDMGGIPVGEDKKLTVSNLMVPRETNEVKFLISLSGNASEISLNNNQLVLTTNSTG